MSKPEEVSLAIERKYGDGNWSFELRQAICDAILAAKQEEREACAAVADEYVWDDHALAQATDIGRAVHHQSVEIAAAIRQRGEG